MNRNTKKPPTLYSASSTLLVNPKNGNIELELPKEDKYVKSSIAGSIRLPAIVVPKENKVEPDSTGTMVALLFFSLVTSAVLVFCRAVAVAEKKKVEATAMFRHSFDTDNLIDEYLGERKDTLAMKNPPPSPSFHNGMDMHHEEGTSSYRTPTPPRLTEAMLSEFKSQLDLSNKSEYLRPRATKPQQRPSLVVNTSTLLNVPVTEKQQQEEADRQFALSLSRRGD